MVEQGAKTKEEAAGGNAKIDERERDREDMRRPETPQSASALESASTTKDASTTADDNEKDASPDEAPPPEITSGDGSSTFADAGDDDQAGLQDDSSGDVVIESDDSSDDTISDAGDGDGGSDAEDADGAEFEIDDGSDDEFTIAPGGSSEEGNEPSEDFTIVADDEDSTFTEASSGDEDDGESSDDFVLSDGSDDEFTIAPGGSSSGSGSSGVVIIEQDNDAEFGISDGRPADSEDGDEAPPDLEADTDADDDFAPEDSAVTPEEPATGDEPESGAAVPEEPVDGVEPESGAAEPADIGKQGANFEALVPPILREDDEQRESSEPVVTEPSKPVQEPDDDDDKEVDKDDLIEKPKIEEQPDPGAFPGLPASGPSAALASLDVMDLASGDGDVSDPSKTADPSLAGEKSQLSDQLEIEQSSPSAVGANTLQFIVPETPVDAETDLPADEEGQAGSPLAATAPDISGGSPPQFATQFEPPQPLEGSLPVSSFETDPDEDDEADDADLP